MGGGCGGSSLPLNQPAPGTHVTARDYLRANVVAARATREYVAELERIQRPASTIALTQAAPRLEARQAAAHLASTRLSAMVVTDRRLEAQRAVIAVRLAGVVREMSAVGTASARGNRRDFVRARAALNGAIVALRGTVNQTP